MKKLFDIQRIIFDQYDNTAFYERASFAPIRLDNHITGILGSRGIGKTTYLLHTVFTHNKAKPNSALYISADNAFLLNYSLLDIADYLYKETTVTLLCIDEIHKYAQWEHELKNISDIYPSLKLLFTGSSMIDIIHSKFDLARRVTLYSLGGLSFREYLAYYLKLDIPPISFTELLTHHENLANSISVNKVLLHFRNYLKYGYYFFAANLSNEVDKYQAIQNITQKTIYEDIGSLHRLSTSTLHTIELVYKFILNSAPGELNITKLSNLVKKSYEQTMDYLTWLEQSGLIYCLSVNKRGNAYIKAPRKLLPENTNLMYAAYLPQTEHQMIGKVRESFFVNQLKMINKPIFYATIGDIQVEEYVFEIGGRNKSTYQLQQRKNSFVVADDILIGDKRTIPLYLFGFLY